MLVTSPSDFDFLEIGLASPEKIRFWSHGEIEKPETINYRTFKPERKGLFCEKIFGPVKDWECACGKYRRVRYRGIVCERCGVEVTHSKVRRERMGHIELAAPVSHIWFLKGIPGYMGLILDMTTRMLEEVLYYDSYIVTECDASIEETSYKALISSDDYYDLKEKYGDKIQADMGASAVRTLLEKVKLGEQIVELRELLVDAKGQKRLKATKRLKIVEALHHSGNHASWMILEAVPVMPPDLRPMVQLEGGRFATSDLNDLYRRVVNRNNRLKRLLDIGAPDMIVRNEKRMLQEAVDVLISNGKRGRAVTGSNGRPLKSLGNIIEGKQGRFRQNLLGKRVDYSGRSVIVVGPHLKFNQCGLPKEMALELFKPFVIRKLVEKGYVTNVKSAKRKIEKRDVYVWDVLEKIIQGQPVLLNRAPTLHRLGIQAFEPVLVEGSAIQVHPLVCTAFNADFDGDQMAVHVPLSLEAQSECRLLIMSTNNVLSPANGRSIITPTQDMVLGIYFLTVEDPNELTGKGKGFATMDEARRAWDSGAIKTHSSIRIRWNGERVETTMGRVIFNRTIKEIFEANDIKNTPFINEIVGKKELSRLLEGWYTEYGSDLVGQIADKLKSLGFKYATLSGISISIDDMRIPKAKTDILADADKEVAELEKQESQGKLDKADRILMSNEVWRGATGKISDLMEDEFGKLNNVFIMANSGARGNIDQVRQLAGMRGLMSDAQGRTVEVPIKSNFKEGLSLAEYFISCYGARKGLVDTALRTADSGYLTRRLVDVAQDVMITELDCGTSKGIELTAFKEGIETIVSIGALLEGRIILKDVKNPSTNKVIAKAGTLITRAIADEIQKTGVENGHVRSSYSCEADRGICQKCYGMDLSTGGAVNMGSAVGIIAAQSIGEPGTQLTMRTFHTGGVDLRKAAKTTFSSDQAGSVKIDDALVINQVMVDGKPAWVSSDEGQIVVESKDSQQIIDLPAGALLHVKPGQKIKAGEEVAEHNPQIRYLSSNRDGKVQFIGLTTKKVEGSSKSQTISVADKPGELFVYNLTEKIMYEVTKDTSEKFKSGERIAYGTELSTKTIVEKSAIIADIRKNPDSTAKKTEYIIETSPGESYPVSQGAYLFVKDGDKVNKGDIVAQERVSGAASMTKDIVQGLPRVEELFEARKPKESAVICELDGTVEVAGTSTARSVYIIGDDGAKKEYKLTSGVRLLVFSGQQVSKGEQLTEGVISPHDLMGTRGVIATQQYLGEEVQRVYKSQGVAINAKHIEVIVRQMTRKINVLTMGETELLPNELVDVRRFNKSNKAAESENKELATGESVLLGITRAALNTESFISASSFQETARVLSDAAIRGKKDDMYGLKENVIIGKLIPAGTGWKDNRSIIIKSQETGEEVKVTEEDRLFKQKEMAEAVVTS
ncbi:DNA-directed RNA polymerase subunit beta' [bacterium]|jgi:DNA-directed RNA polymerase subunit beta'|nr:DNA-directed RNA polymerase subunit beta' [bacterium]